MKIHVLCVDWSTHGDRLGAIREKVFIDEQGVDKDLEWDGQDETAVLPLKGSVHVEVEGRTYVLDGRSELFGERTDFLYVPIDTEMRITGQGPLPSGR